MRASLWTYPWDLLDEGVDATLARIADGGGFDGLSLAATYHATKALLPHNPRRRVYFAEDGVAYFRTRPERYGRIKPRPSALLAQADPFALAGEQAARHGLALHAWVICLHSTPLASLHPDLTLQTPFGDPLLHSLCPSQPEVRRYAVALLADLCGQYPLRSVELEAIEFMGYVHDFHHEKNLAPLAPFEWWLLGLCFCPACRARARTAGLDAARLAGRVQEHLTLAFRRDRPPRQAPDAADWLAADADFAAYLRLREQTVRSLVGEIKDTLSSFRDTQVLCFAAPGGGWRDGADPERLATVADGFVSAYFPDVAAGEEGIPALRRLARGKPVSAAVSATHPAATGAADVRARILAYAAAGADGFNVYNYGLSPLPYLAAAQEALAQVRSGRQ